MMLTHFRPIARGGNAKWHIAASGRLALGVLGFDLGLYPAFFDFRVSPVFCG